MNNVHHEIDTLLFDLDGTLTNLMVRVWHPFLRAVMKIRKNQSAEIYDEIFSKRIRYILDSTTGNAFLVPINVFWRVTRILELNFIETIKMLYYIATDKEKFKEVIALNGAEDFVMKAKSRYKLGLVTTASKNTVGRAIEQNPWFEHFTVVIHKNDVKKTKPHPESIVKAMKHLGSQPKKTLVIGDLPHDIIAGNEAGCITIAVFGLHKEHTKDLVLDAKPDYAVDDLQELSEFLSLDT